MTILFRDGRPVKCLKTDSQSGAVTGYALSSGLPVVPRFIPVGNTHAKKEVEQYLQLCQELFNFDQTSTQSTFFLVRWSYSLIPTIFMIKY